MIATVTLIYSCGSFYSADRVSPFLLFAFSLSIFINIQTLKLEFNSI